MNTIKVSVGNTKMIAHRGCSRLERENTMAAFIAAGNRSYYGIETDIHCTKDGKYIIIHDSDTARVGACSMNVEKSDFAELRRILLTDLDGSVGREDLHLPTLEEYLLTCRKYEKVGVLEIKAAFSVAQMDEVMEAIGDYAENMIIISFHYASLLNLRVHHPNQRAQYLCYTLDDLTLESLAANGFGLDIKHSGMSPELLAKCRARGIETQVWTVDDPAECERFAAMGVDYITSNCCEAKTE